MILRKAFAGTTKYFSIYKRSNPLLLTTNPIFSFSSAKNNNISPQNKLDQSSEEPLNEEFIELTKDQIQKMIKDRKAQLEVIVAEKKIPLGALITSMIVTAPLILGSIGLNYCCMNNMYLEYVPGLFINLIKYSGLHLSFMAGIQWGFSMSDHDCQPDSENSSPQVRRNFILSSIPLILGFALTGNFVYFFNSLDTQAKLIHLGGLAALHLGIFIKDILFVRQKSAPLWYTKLKFFITLFSVLSILSLGMIITDHQDKVKININPLKKYMNLNENVSKVTK